MPGLDSCGFGVQNPEGIIKIHGGIALDTVCNNVVCRYHTCNVQCGRGQEKKRVLPNKVSDFPYVGELSADLSLLSDFTFEHYSAPIGRRPKHPQHFLQHLVGIDTEPVLATVPIFGDEFNIERRRLLCAFTVQQEKLRINALAKSKTIAYEIGEKIHAFEQVRLARCIIAIDDGNGENPTPCPLLFLCAVPTFAEHGKFLLAFETQAIFNSEVEQHSFRSSAF
ncbi:hypothetical protein [Bifidobacterium breve]|uniref:hypothetical protein n=1 Tax=Bifidobacterium breve TaxID=1685 RepID=UPI003F64E288